MAMRSTSLACAAAAVACLDAATAFAPLSALPATSSARQQQCAAPLVLRAHADADAMPRRSAALRLAVLAAGPLLLPHRSAYAEEVEAEAEVKTEVKKSKKQRDAEYEEDLSGMKQPRYGRQPTRLDVERCVPKIAPIKGVMDAVASALESEDLAGVAKAIGDQTVEATKSNVNLGKEISTIQISKSYFYQYANKFSKGKPSLLTADMLKALDVFYPSMALLEVKAKAGDKDAADAAFAQAQAAIKTVVDAIEAECRDGRLNSIKVSLAVLEGKGDAKGLNVYQENMKEMRRRAKEGGGERKQL